jgi:ABC-2 type transport system permease protein
MIVVAVREYLAAVRTKAFVISIVIMPLLMGGSALVQYLLEDIRDTTEKRFAVIDRSGGRLFSAVEKEVEKHNKEAEGKAPFKVVNWLEEKEKPPPADDDPELGNLRGELSEEVRTGKLFGFLDIGPDVYRIRPEAEVAAGKKARAGPGKALGGKGDSEAPVRYQSNRPTHQEFPALAEKAITKAVQEYRAHEMGLDTKMDQLRGIMQEVPVASLGLSQRDPVTGKFEDGTDRNRFAPVLVPIGFMLLMFMVIMMSATPLMQNVVEEKMQRIAEVLLGSVGPFQLMLGKLIGMTGVSMTVTAVYLSGAYWLANHFKAADSISASLLAWFIVYQALAALMYGSLFGAIGAACTDLKETQNLLWPVMLLATSPMFVLGSILQEPNSSAATALSFFPFATPMLMIARLAVPPGIDAWQPALGVLVVLLTTLVCVYAAGRIFRVGLLLQGKGARLGDIVKWVVRG